MMELSTSMLERAQDEQITLVHNVLSLPLELREKIYGYLFSNHERVFWYPSMPLGNASHDCPLDVIRCCRQLLQETRDFLHRRTISFSFDPESGCMLSNIPCLHGLDLSKGSCIKFELNPFQYTTSITKLWKSLLWTCDFLEKAPHILRLEIECDGRLPRLRPPMYINEVDLERGPLIIVLLLQPFNLLYNVGQAKVTILGGPSNNLWSTNLQLQGCAARLEKQMEAIELPHTMHISNLRQVRHGLQQDCGVFWYDGSYQHAYVTLVNGCEFTPTTDENAGESH
jgi:hypothetical protein